MFISTFTAFLFYAIRQQVGEHEEVEENTPIKLLGVHSMNPRLQTFNLYELINEA